MLNKATSQALRNSKTVLLIGAGRLANHLIHWNSLLTKPNTLLTWNRKEPIFRLHELSSKADLVWLAISDSALVPFFEEHLKSFGKPVVHFSGACSDPRMLSAHPLMTFPENRLEDEVYPRISFALTGTKSLDNVLPGFDNPFFFVSPEMKPLYHALCVVAGNFPQMLWSEVSSQMKSLDVPDQALQTYLEQVLKNFTTLKEKAVTGPLIRKDGQTIEKNISALAGTKLQRIYEAFRKEFGS